MATIRWAVTVLLLLLFGLFVWPTRYEYIDSYGGNLIRINRLTGKIEMLVPQAWWEDVSPTRKHKD